MTNKIGIALVLVVCCSAVNASMCFERSYGSSGITDNGLFNYPLELNVDSSQNLIFAD